MTWKLFAVVVWLASWQVCHAGDLVSLVSPLARWEARDWKLRYMLFDGDRSTYWTYVKRGGQMVQLEYRGELFWEDELRPTHYRITMPAHVPKKDYPTTWTVSDLDFYFDKYFDVVTDAVFKNGVYEGPLGHNGVIDSIIFRFPKRKTLTIADIELLGPRKALDGLWPYGKYPCSQRLVGVPPTEFAKIFARPKPEHGIPRPNPTRGVLSRMFKFTNWRFSTIFNFDGFKPITIGAVLRKPTMVREVVTDVLSSRKIVLQGSFCRPHCRKYGSKGWVKLAKHDPKKGSKISIKNPDKYKGYRLKVYRKNAADNYIAPRHIFFTYCPE